MPRLNLFDDYSKHDNDDIDPKDIESFWYETANLGLSPDSISKTQY